MKKIMLSFAVALAASTGAFAQNNDVQHATLGTTIPRLIALRPYSPHSTEADNQSLSTTITNATDVLNNNNFTYAGNNGYNGLAYRIYCNTTYAVSLSATSTSGSNDELNNYINFYAETLPSPENGIAPYAPNNNGDHTIDVPAISNTDMSTRLATAAVAPVQLLHNYGYNTGKYVPPANPYSPLDPVNTDFAAFGVKFVCSPGFAVFPGVFTTNLTITATSL